MKRFALAFLVVAALIGLMDGCSKRPTATDPASMVRGLFDELNRGNAKAAASYFSDDGEFVTPWGQPTGRAKIENMFKTNFIPLKTRVVLQESTVEGSKLTGTFTITNVWLKNNYPSGVPLFAVLSTFEAGKIKTMTWTAAK